VTHDQREALMLSDRIGVMRAGRLEQVGTGLALYEHPSTRFVAEFLGDANLFDGTVKSVDPPVVATGTGAFITVGDLGGAEPGDAVTVVARAEAMRLGRAGEDLPTDNQFPGTVELRAFEGSAMYYELAIPGLSERVKISAASALSREVFERGDRVTLGWSSDQTPVVPMTGAS